jgi:hypothetical protein
MSWAWRPQEGPQQALVVSLRRHCLPGCYSGRR